MEKSTEGDYMNEEWVIDNLRQLGFTVKKDGVKKVNHQQLFSAVLGKTESRLILG
ncbi:hypothetical protein [Melghirimyces algeriensis]|uniref:Uncharacterized protein n=1 Tax=Melghirimyces algeriensis TaxID=910412 RepID=A0A521EKJ7_9BACL|nr:hypothetical protein [Melghirimyces algeriensis]SMO84001.1 hypothetical protein SAMN06264849_109107 [Melghirimyces algeriensis]